MPDPSQWDEGLRSVLHSLPENPANAVKGLSRHKPFSPLRCVHYLFHDPLDRAGFSVNLYAPQALVPLRPMPQVKQGVFLIPDKVRRSRALF